MNSKDLKEYKKMLSKLSDAELKERDLYLRKLALGELEGPPVGYASIDKPWLKYYDEDLVRSSIPYDTIYGYVYNQNKYNLENVVFNYFGKEIKYNDFFKKVNEIANSLIINGVEKGDIVTIGMASVPEAYYTLYAINKIGAVADVVDMFGNTEENLKNCINETDSKILLINDLVLGNVMRIRKDINVDKIVVASLDESLDFDLPNLPKIDYKENNGLVSWSNFVNEGKMFEYCRYDKYSIFGSDVPAVLEHTGGTTGFPKGCELTNNGLNGQVWQLANSPLQFKRGEVWLGLMPIFASFGLMGGHLAISQGLVSVLVPFYDPNELVNLIEKYKPNRFACSPAFLEALLNSDKLDNLDIDSIRNPLVGGDFLNLKTERKMNDLFRSKGNSSFITKGYGLTEFSAGGTCNMGGFLNREVSTGVPLVKNNVCIVELGTINELPYDEIGEICLSGSNNMLGYYNRSRETNEALKIHDDGKVWLHTGDIGKIDKDGYLYLTTRIKRIIIRNDGCKVYPPFVEEVIMKHPDVLDCSVEGVNDVNYDQGELPYAYIVLNDNSKDISKVNEEILSVCNRDLPMYSIPISFEEIEKLPRTKVGKIDHEKLKEMANKKMQSKNVKKKIRTIN